jgi:hypothetical protein
MSNDNLKLVKVQLIKDPGLTADSIAKNLKVSKAYGYNLLSLARKALHMVKQPDGTWKFKPRMETVAVMTTKESVKQHIVEEHFPTEDVVNHPSHYLTGGVETIDFIEAKNLNYRLGNVVKYLTRADHKGDRLENLKKAQWYLEREIAKSAQ